TRRTTRSIQKNNSSVLIVHFSVLIVRLVFWSYLVQLDVASAAVLDVYRLLVGVVTPRPIAWVTTLSPAGVVNLAPFSFFNAFGANPPIVIFSPTLRRDGSKKDTLINLESLGEFVLNAATAPLAEQVNLTSKEIPRIESKFPWPD